MVCGVSGCSVRVCPRWVAYDDATQRMELLGREDTLPVWVEGERAVSCCQYCQCLVRFHVWPHGIADGSCTAAEQCAGPATSAVGD
jgi:hypothetical protein